MSDWTTLARVKRHVNLDPSNTDLDAKISDLIPAASRMLEKYIGRVLDTTTYTEYFDGDGLNEVLVGFYPIQSIASIYDDPLRTFLPATLVDPANYVFNNNENENVGYIRYFQSLGYFQKGIQNIKITYTAGYDAIPEDAEMACVMLVSWILNRSASEGMSSAALGGKSETYEMESIPVYIKRMVAPYKKWTA